MSYQVTDRNGKVHTSKAKSHKECAQILHKEGKTRAFWFKSFEAAEADRAKIPSLDIEIIAC